VPNVIESGVQKDLHAAAILQPPDPGAKQHVGLPDLIAEFIPGQVPLTDFINSPTLSNSAVNFSLSDIQNKPAWFISSETDPPTVWVPSKNAPPVRTEIHFERVKLEVAAKFSVRMSGEAVLEGRLDNFRVTEAQVTPSIAPSNELS
jgi:hypothetical protein